MGVPWQNEANETLNSCQRGIVVEVFIIACLVIAAWWLLKRKRGSSSARPNGSGAGVVVTLTSSIRTRAEGRTPRDVGPVSAAGPQTWVLSPRAPLPLTLVGGDEQLANSVKSILANADYWSRGEPGLALLIAQHNLRFTEVDEFLGKLRPRFDAEVAKLLKASPDWQGASDKDREDIRVEAEKRALDGLGVDVGGVDLGVLLKGQPNVFTEDDALIASFGGDHELYSFYLNKLGRGAAVTTVKADDWGRKLWERLAERGLALRGKDIPATEILEGLRLKDLNELLAGTTEKLPGRKAKALELATALPDLEARLAESVSFRELFRVSNPSGLNVASLGASLGYATEVASIVLRTYVACLRTMDTIEEGKADQEAFDAWEVESPEDPMPACARQYCKKAAKLPSRLPPFHIGCTCELSLSFKD